MRPRPRRFVPLDAHASVGFHLPGWLQLLGHKQLTVSLRPVRSRRYVARSRPSFQGGSDRRFFDSFSTRLVTLVTLVLVTLVLVTLVTLVLITLVTLVLVTLVTLVGRLVTFVTLVTIVLVTLVTLVTIVLVT